MAKYAANTRAAVLDKIGTKLAMFIVQETYLEAGEDEIRRLLIEAVDTIDKAAGLAVANDGKAAK